jgi:perosamine synthetase
VYSPIEIRAVARSVGVAITGRGDPRPGLEATLRDAYRADQVVLCGSGTDALQLALRAARRATGDGPVALPAFTCFDVAAAAVAAGSTIMLYDIDPGTLAPDLDDVRRALRQGARAVVVAPLFGLSPDWDALNDCLAEHGAIAIEDAAQGHGASWRGRPLGALAPLSVLSFGRGKGWTGGQGGALLLRDGADSAGGAVSPGLAAELRVLIGAAAQHILGSPSLYALPAAVPWLGLGETHYRPAAAPAGITRVAAALLAASRTAAETEAADRRRVAAWWQEAIPPRDGVRTVRAHPDAEPGYLRFPLRLACGVAGLKDARPALRLGLAPVYPAPLSAVPEAARLLVVERDAWPGAEELARTLVTLPTHSRVTDRERDRLLTIMLAHPR